ncbi:MAG: hypothetical protein ABI193_13915 [Minicystis sp.]
MKIGLPLVALALAALAASTLVGCGKSDPPAPSITVPTSSDPEGKDLVEGAVVAAEEQVGGMRLYKLIHVDDYPDPIGWEYHFVAYDPKAPTFEEAAKLWASRAVKVANPHIEVRQVFFLPRSHRVLAVEPVTEAERSAYLKARDGRK